MQLIRQVNESVTKSENLIHLIEQFEGDILQGREITNENLVGILDRVKYAVTKPSLSDAEKQTIARLLTALTWIKHNVNDADKSEKLRDLIDAPMIGDKDIINTVDQLSPGALKKRGPQAFMQDIFQDISQGGERTRQAIADVSSLKQQDFDRATVREPVRKQAAQQRAPIAR